MPYKKGEPPDRIKGLPKHAQDIWISAFDAAWGEYDHDEEKANKIAWAAVKKAGYYQDKDGVWHAPKESNQGKKVFEEICKYSEIKILEATEEDKLPRVIEGIIMQVDVPSANNNLYSREVISEAIQAWREDQRVGFDHHRFDEPISELVLKHLDLRIDEKGYVWAKSKIIPNSKGKDFAITLKEGIRPGYSIVGSGDSEYVNYGEGKHKVNRLLPGYRFSSIDTVISPAFEMAGITDIIESKQNNEKPDLGGNIMEEETKKLIESLRGSIDSVQKELNTLKEKGIKDDERTKALEDESKKNKARLEAIEYAESLLTDEAKMKDLNVDFVRKHLKDCVTKEAVDTKFAIVKDTLKEYPDLGKTTEAKGKTETVEIRDNYRGIKFAENCEQVMKQLCEKVADNGQNNPDDTLSFGNPRYVLRMILEDAVCRNLLRGKVIGRTSRFSDRDLYSENKYNPLWFLTKKGQKHFETIGDNWMQTGDVATANAQLLPVIAELFKGLWPVINEIAGVFPLSQPSGKVFFKKAYYWVSAGVWSEINAANFSRTAAAVAEEGTPKRTKIIISYNDIAIDTPLKVQFPYNVETALYIRSSYGIDLDTEGVRTIQDEIQREIASQALYYLITGTAFTNSDGLIQAVGSPLNYETVCPPGEGYTQAEWDNLGFTKFLSKLAALCYVEPFNVIPNKLAIDKDYLYLISGKPFTSDNPLQPTQLGLTRVQGDKVPLFTCFASNVSEITKKVLTWYRGASPIDAPIAFCPFSLFELEPMVVGTTFQHTWLGMSLFSIDKLIGTYFAQGDIV
jgi:cation transport regulator